MKRLGQWVGVVLCLTVSLGSLLPGVEGGRRATPFDVKLELGRYFFNPSIVKHKGVYLSTARTAEMKRVDSTTWVSSGPKGGGGRWVCH